VNPELQCLGKALGGLHVLSLFMSLAPSVSSSALSPHLTCQYSAGSGPALLKRNILPAMDIFLTFLVAILKSKKKWVKLIIIYFI
jgi:hypothetical protein